MREAVLLSQARSTIQSHSARCFPQEACGLLIGRVEDGQVRVTRALTCPNVAPPEERARRFAIDPRVVINVRRSLRGGPDSIVGFYHSHPDAEAVPSAVDREHIALWPDTLWMIVPVAGGEPGVQRAWWLDAAEGSGLRELPVRVVVPRVAALTACPE